MTQPLDDVLLGLIAVQPQHGYQLLDYFRSTAALGSVWNLSQSQLYAVLKRLERGGLVLGVARASPDAPTRVEYSLTDAGQTRLHHWLFTDAPPDKVEDIRIQFLSRLYVARRLNLPTVQIVRQQRRLIEARYRQQTDARAGASSGIEWLTREFELEQLQAVLRWIERCEFVPRDEDDDAPPV
jgi:DNA-binding PadR family transcriptional regulator